MVDIGPGAADPLGATIVQGGVNFSVFARRATGLDLLLFDDVEQSADRATVVALDPAAHRTGDYWHAVVPGLGSGQLYGFAAHGPWSPEDGARFDPTRVLLDPYGRGTAVPTGYRRLTAADPADASIPMKSVVVDLVGYDWEGDRRLHRPFRETVVYEAHLAGFTADPSSGVAPGRRGTYLGFIDRIPYLVELGVTAVELLPIFQFDAQTAPAGRTNHWGYQPVGFFAPHAPYASGSGPQAAVDEFRDLVKALHRAGIEVILDVVYNHTAEGDATGPSLSFRGLADDDYYLFEPDGTTYADFTGTGNTINTNGPIVRRMIRDSLRYWAHEMHVDGFRFDLASVMSRDGNGHPIPDPPVLADIETDPILAGTKLIAEAWDAGGLYQVGSFAGDRWVEWNGRFRDDVRAFLRGDPGKVDVVTTRILGSPDLYGHKDPDVESSLNFVTCHDGFTLNDLVSYDRKHNTANGEDDRDGSDHNLSWNGGVEGPTDDPTIERLRERRIRGLLAVNVLSIGVPMLLMGDEIRRTQGGNNNGYTLDGPGGWFDWEGVTRHAGLVRFTRGIIGLRRSVLDVFEAGDPERHGVVVGEPDTGPDSHSLALTFRAGDRAAHLIVNAWWEPLEFALPPPAATGTGAWRRMLDTSLDPPDDLIEEVASAPSVGTSCMVDARTVVLLLS